MVYAHKKCRLQACRISDLGPASRCRTFFVSLRHSLSVRWPEFGVGYYLKKGAWLREVISFLAKDGTSDIFCGTAFHGHQTTPSLFRVEVHFEVHICAQTVVSNPNDRYPNPLRIRDSEQGERGGNGFVNRRSGVRFPSPAPVIPSMALIRAASAQIPLKSNGPPNRGSAFNSPRRFRQFCFWVALSEHMVRPGQIRVHIGCILLQANGRHSPRPPIPIHDGVGEL